jgi:hypothetical protein
VMVDADQITIRRNRTRCTINLMVKRMSPESPDDRKV